MSSFDRVIALCTCLYWIVFASSDTEDEVIQIKSDELVALSLQEEFNREISVSDLELSQLHEGIDHQSPTDDEAGIVKVLEGKVLREKEPLYIVL